MNPKDDDRAPELDLLSRQAQQRLRARVANSDIETVWREFLPSSTNSTAGRRQPIHRPGSSGSLSTPSCSHS